MKNILIYLFVILISVNFSNLHATINIKARTVILQDFLSGTILYEKDADRKIFPASMTKIMTTIVTFDLLKKMN